ncbi:hypothetical protein RchiOBHm_Chr3g0465071 [Rosa chinensis]|uniref:Uncharacterized protein n=1 Tax=Rosa chinensis TaxID=74649 RepID=A0A2P6R9M3_ROSCH|nr:hypothetical protein RchiOBHm_Chr3g0465071 [Rosa chinensis]
MKTWEIIPIVGFVGFFVITALSLFLRSRGSLGDGGHGNLSEGGANTDVEATIDIGPDDNGGAIIDSGFIVTDSGGGANFGNGADSGGGGCGGGGGVGGSA